MPELLPPIHEQNVLAWMITLLARRNQFVKNVALLTVLAIQIVNALLIVTMPAEILPVLINGVYAKQDSDAQVLLDAMIVILCPTHIANNANTILTSPTKAIILVVWIASARTKLSSLIKRNVPRVIQTPLLTMQMERLARVVMNFANAMQGGGLVVLQMNQQPH
jgi:predicted metal-dependent HD superfamily phosphohydrolase